MLWGQVGWHVADGLDSIPRSIFNEREGAKMNDSERLARIEMVLWIIAALVGFITGMVSAIGA